MRRDDGGYSAVEMAIVMPALFAGIMLVVQLALVWHGRHAAAEAAGRGLAAASAYQATTNDGRTAADRYLQDVAPKLLRDPSVTVTRTDIDAEVTVTAHVLGVIPVLGNVTVTQSVAGPVERFVSPT